MSNDFSARGYITLTDLDSLSNQIDDLKNNLGITNDNVKTINSQTSDFLYYRNDGDSKSTALKFVQSGIEAQRIKVDVKDEGKITVTFKQDFKEIPIVCATIDGSKDQYACQIDSVSKKHVVIRFMKVKTVANNNSIKEEFVNVIAVGQTKN